MSPRLHAGWNRRRVIAVAIALAISTEALSQELAGVEPELEPQITDYVLEIDGRPTPLSINSRVTVQIDGKSHELVLVAPSIKHFAIPVLSFDFPGHFRYEMDRPPKGLRSWSLEGEDFLIQIYAFPKSKTFEELTRFLVAGIPGTFVGEKLTQTVCEIQLDVNTYAGVEFDLEFTLADKTVPMQFAFFDLRLSDERYRYVLNLKDSPGIGGGRSQEAAQALEILKKSFKVQTSKAEE